jgi:predicted acylesterase/phospholipase RssA
LRGTLERLNLRIGLRVLVAFLLVLSGCSMLIRNDAVPVALEPETRIPIPGLPDGIRYRVGHAEDRAALSEEFAKSWTREREHLASQGYTGPLPPTAFLALSGGGDQGAFGAGLLNGWTAAGNRPQFKLVTGISTGALIAPFAFLGSAYDARLKELFTNISARDVLKLRGYVAALTSDAMADTQPLRRMLARHVDRAMLDAIAVEYVKGRELWIATTNLDSRERYIWNLTRIAATQHPKALDLFHSLMIASAAIPGAFPPVLIDVEAAGRAYQEMHVDGGAMAQVFVYPIGLDFEALAAEHNADRHRTLYVIRNSRLDPEWAQVERRTLSIAGRAISSLIHTQGVGDLYRIYLTAQRDGLDFNLAYIPAQFDAPHKADFDRQFMRALFETGYEMAAKGYPWEKVPPDYATIHK